jgi:hypothetical protein
LDVQQNRLAGETQGDEGAAKLQEGQMNVGAVLVADGDPRWDVFMKKMGFEE